jgi:hypothetical protein
VKATLDLVALFTLPGFFRKMMIYNGKKVVLSERQLGLLKLKMAGSEGGGKGEQTKRPSKTKPLTPSGPIVPIERSLLGYGLSQPLGQSRRF